MEIISVFLVVVVASVFATSLYKDMKSKIQALDVRIHALEQASKQRLPFRSQDEILNAMAALDVLVNEFQFGTDLIENAKAHLAKSMRVGTIREEFQGEK